MLAKIPSTFHGRPAAGPAPLAPASLAYRAGLFALVLIGALAVFVLGTNYYPAFPTNGSLAYAAALAAVFLAAAWLLKRDARLAPYWPLAYAFFAASMVNVVSVVLVGYGPALLRPLGVLPNSNAFTALAKGYDVLLGVVTIVVLVKVSGADLGSLYLRRGDLKWGLGIGSLVLLNFLTSALIFQATGYNLDKLGSAIGWGAVFAFSNGLLEELWFRGLFLKKLTPLLGVAGAIAVSSIWFAALHLLSVTYLPAYTIPIFLVNTLTLGIACGWLMVKTGSLWGAVLIHAAADWFLFIALLAVR